MTKGFLSTDDSWRYCPPCRWRPSDCFGRPLACQILSPQSTSSEKLVRVSPMDPLGDAFRRPSRSVDPMATNHGELDWGFSQVFGERTPGEEVQDGTCGAVTSHYIVSIIGCVGRVFLAFSHHTQLLVIRPSLTKCSVTSQCTHTACVDRHAKRRPRCTHRTHTTQMHIRDEDKH